MLPHILLPSTKVAVLTTTLEQHEATHVATISAILEKSGYAPVPACSYNFPYNSPTSFVDLANMITSVGIGA